jgi:hypothetical protein
LILPINSSAHFTKLQLQKMQVNFTSAIRFVQRNFGTIFFLLLATNILILSLMFADVKLTYTPQAPDGTTSLQFNRVQDSITPIINSWEHQTDTSHHIIERGGIYRVTINGLQVAKRQTLEDFIFILLYVMTAAALLLELAYKRGVDYIPVKDIRLLKAALYLVLAAAFFNVVENCFMLLAMHRFNPAWQFLYFPATINIAILLAILLYLVYRTIDLKYLFSLPHALSNLLVGTMNILVRFRIVVISHLALFVIIWLADQGRDLLLIINSSIGGFIFFLFSIWVLALLSWYFPKYYEFVLPWNQRPEAGSRVTFLSFFLGRYRFPSRMTSDKIDIARILGTLTFLIAATGILNAMRIFKIPYFLEDVNPFLLLILTTTFYCVALSNNWISKLFAPANRVAWDRVAILAAIIFAGIIFPFVLEQNKRPQFLAWISFDLFLLSFGFLVFATIRTCVDRTKPILRWNITPIITILGLIYFLFFLIVNINPGLVYFSQSLRFFTLPVVISAFVFYVFLFTYLLIAGRNTGIRFITIVLLLGIIVSAVHKNSLHKVILLARDPSYREEDSLDHYAYKWLASRTKEIRAFKTGHGKPYPVFFINAYGGGIRAAAWTSLVIDTLQIALKTRMRADSNLSNDFQHYVFSYSGASGGTIGCSVLCASRYHSLTTGSPDTLDVSWKSIFEKDYLTPVLTTLFGSDVWNSVVGQHFGRDRAAVQEDLWQSQLKDYKIEYGHPMSWYWNNPSVKLYEIPLLFANTYNVDSGLKGITAPVLLNPNHFPGTIFVQNLARRDSGVIKLSTGSFLSARFPIVSPTGKFDEEHHFMDGGLKENSGAETSRQVMAVVDSVWKQLAKDSSLQLDDIQFKILSIPNGVHKIDSIQKAKNLFELTAPLTALENNWIGNTTTADLINVIDTAEYHYVYLSIQPGNLPVHDFFPVLPLGWQISDEALELMLKSIRGNPDLETILATFGSP